MPVPSIVPSTVPVSFRQPFRKGTGIPPSPRALFIQNTMCNIKESLIFSRGHFFWLLGRLGRRGPRLSRRRLAGPQIAARFARGYAREKMGSRHRARCRHWSGSFSPHALLAVSGVRSVCVVCRASAARRRPFPLVPRLRAFPGLLARFARDTARGWLVHGLILRLESVRGVIQPRRRANVLYPACWRWMVLSALAVPCLERACEIAVFRSPPRYAWARFARNTAGWMVEFGLRRCLGRSLGVALPCCRANSPCGRSPVWISVSICVYLRPALPFPAARNARRMASWWRGSEWKVRVKTVSGAADA